MRNLANVELKQVSGGLTKEGAVLGLAAVAVVTVAAVIMSTPRYPNDIHLYSSVDAYNKGYSDGYWSAFGWHVLLPDLINAVAGASFDSEDNYY